MPASVKSYLNKPLDNAEDGNGELIPHVYTFASIFNSISKTYSYRWDEAVRNNPQNALAMERDCYIESLRQERCMATVNREWNIKGDNDKDPVQKACASHMKAIIDQTPRFKRMLEYLTSGATWMGRYGAQIVVRQRNVLGIPRWCIVKHKPVNGDKIQGSWDDVPAIQIHHGGLMTERFGDSIVFGDRVPMLLLKQRKHRDQFIIHTYKVRDADYFEGEMAGAAQGEGLRNKIYWAWWCRDELLSWSMDVMRKAGTMGLLIFPFEEGSEAGEAKAKLNAQKASVETAMVMPVVNNGLRGSETSRPLHIPGNPGGVAELRIMISDYFERHMERLIVGQSMSSGGGGGGGLEGDGRAEFAEDTKFQQLHFDADNLGETLTTDVVDLLMRLNFPEYDFKMRFKFVVPDPRASAKLQDILALVGVGVGAKTDQLREMAGIETPDPGDDTVGSIEQVYAKHGEAKYLTPRGGLAVNRSPAQQDADGEGGPPPLQLAERDSPELYYPEQPAEDAELARGHREGGWHPFGTHTQLGANHEKMANDAGLPGAQLHGLARNYHESTGMHPAIAYGHALANLKLAGETMGRPGRAPSPPKPSAANTARGTADIPRYAGEPKAKPRTAERGTKGNPFSLDEAPQRGTAPPPPKPSGKTNVQPGVSDPRFAGDAKAGVPFAEPTDEPATGTAQTPGVPYRLRHDSQVHPRYAEMRRKHQEHDEKLNAVGVRGQEALGKIHEQIQNATDPAERQRLQEKWTDAKYKFRGLKDKIRGKMDRLAEKMGVYERDDESTQNQTASPRSRSPKVGERDENGAVIGGYVPPGGKPPTGQTPPDADSGGGFTGNWNNAPKPGPQPTGQAPQPKSKPADPADLEQAKREAEAVGTPQQAFAAKEAELSKGKPDSKPSDKGTKMEESARKRWMRGELTGIEQSDAAKLSRSLSHGRKVKTPHGSGVIEGKPSFGHFNVRHENGTVKRVHGDDIDVLPVSREDAHKEWINRKLGGNQPEPKPQPAQDRNAAIMSVIHQWKPSEKPADPRHNPDLDAAMGMAPNATDWREARSGSGEYSPATGKWRPREKLGEHLQGPGTQDDLVASAEQSGKHRDAHAAAFLDMMRSYSRNPQQAAAMRKYPHLGSLVAGNPIDWKHAHNLRDEVETFLNDNGVVRGWNHPAERLLTAANHMVHHHEESAQSKWRAENWKKPEEPKQSESEPDNRPSGPTVAMAKGGDDGIFDKKNAPTNDGPLDAAEPSPQVAKKPAGNGKPSVKPQPSDHDMANELLKNHTDAVLEGHNASIQDHNAAHDEISEGLAHAWLHDPQKNTHPSVIRRKINSGHIEQASDIPAIEDMAATMARKYPHLFTHETDEGGANSANHEEQLFDLFKAGRKRKMTRADAEEKALELIANMHDPNHVVDHKKKYNDEVIPFQEFSLVDFNTMV